MELSGQLALVTGGASGLGAATAAVLAEAGARVAVVDLDAAGATRVAETLGGKGYGVDVADGAAMAAAIEDAQAAMGPLRVAVSCAGIVHGARLVGREGPADLAAFERVIRVNLIGTFNVMRLAAAAMSGHVSLADGARGVIVNTASIAAFEGQIGQGAYAASKGGVAALTLPAARELARHGIRVAAIAPGLFATPMMTSLPQDVQDSLAATTPFPHRLGDPAEFGRLVRHICENDMINGSVLRLDGALRLQPK